MSREAMSKAWSGIEPGIARRYAASVACCGGSHSSLIVCATPRLRQVEDRGVEEIPPARLSRVVPVP